MVFLPFLEIQCLLSFFLQTGSMVLGQTVHQCLSYRSRVADRTTNEGGADVWAILEPIKTFCILTCFPPLCVPLGVLYGVASLRALATLRLPYRNHEPIFTDDVEYCIYRRVYDTKNRRLLDDQVAFDPDTLEYALDVVGERRRQYVDDPYQKGVAYMLIERRQINRGFALRGSIWGLGITTDMLRTAVPMCLCLAFWPATTRLSKDLVLVAQGRLQVANVRHPIPNFFLTVNDYNKAKHRIVTTQPAKVTPMQLKL